MSDDARSELAAAMMAYLEREDGSGDLDSLAELGMLTSYPGQGTAPTSGQLEQLWQLVQLRLSRASTITARVRKLIRAQLARGRIGMDSVACQLHISRHTLYQRLKAENQCFAGLLEQERREQAMRYLAMPDPPLVIVAERLGFSELSAFSRAFKRWAGLSPAAYRARMLAG
ncbi:helix-turn-helix transcriptional regulator [Marinobacter xestospongiae]|uniref:helix-turn-helix transcriptional regulator n=1 Tax=Marinobacter xestospongiae TaxID=994319 RepID=UPI0020068BA9|nr:helix-turn-helix transcriptional regulator [Marinobacter xestospongiae]MCK7565096.1 helix-turn-helix transcriptional regulator [Marinobacter xestospongiae]